MGAKPDAKTDKGKKQKIDEKLDDALDHSFPASDPPSMIDPQKHIGGTPDKKPDQNNGAS